MDRENLNDFGQRPPYTVTMTMGGKETVNDKISLSIFNLSKRSIFKERRIYPHRIEVGGISMRLVRDPLAHDWYLNMEAGYGPKCNNSTISIVTTKCYYGGTREWFECPKCHKRAGILYLDNDNFSCRKCLNLTYISQKMNYRTLSPFIVHLKKAESAPFSKNWQEYKGKPTKRALRFWKIRERGGRGMQLLESKYGSRD